jgi:hypothetical protein
MLRRGFASVAEREIKDSLDSYACHQTVQVQLSHLPRLNVFHA